MKQEHIIKPQGPNSNLFDCSCGLKSSLIESIAAHIKAVSQVSVMQPEASKPKTQTEPKITTPDFIKHIELATGKKHIVINNEDYYISQNEIEAIKNQVLEKEESNDFI